MSRSTTRIRDFTSVMKQQLLPRRGFPFVHAIEEPDATMAPAAHTVLVKGWLLTPTGATVERIAVEHGTVTDLMRVARPDVGARWPRREVVGFQGIVLVDERVRPGPWQLAVTVDGTQHRRELHASIDESGRSTFAAQKATKLERLEPLLRCPRPLGDDPRGPSCLGELQPDGDELVCARCAARFCRSAGRFDFLTSELRDIGAIDPTAAISSWGYDPIATRLIEEFADGLVLDAGSGLKAHYLDNVVNLEVVDYPTTDVVAIGERLPFATGSFDAALSLVVLEHVRDPFRCAAEIARVVRRGGKIYVAVPFLQPYHGYPHHYYNMTRRGLEQLFDDAFEIEECSTAAYGLPIFTLTWFLNSYLKGLPPATAHRLGGMRVRELLDDGHTYLDAPFVGHLSPEAVEELACSNFLVATKR